MENENVIENTEKPKKAGKARFITSIVLLTLCIVLVVGTVACSFIKKDYNPGVNNPDYIVVTTADSSSPANKSMLSKGSEKYNEIMELYNSSFKTTFFNALFQGLAFEGVTEKDEYKSLSTLSGPYLEFNYTESQTLYVNGQTYEEYAAERKAKTGVSPIVANSNYISLVVEVIDSSSLTLTNIYFKYRDTGTYNYSYIRLMTYAKQSALYDYIENMK